MYRYRSHSCWYHHSAEIHIDIQKPFLSVSPFSKDTHRYTEVSPVGITIQQRYTQIYRSHSCWYHHSAKIHTDIQKSFLSVSPFSKDTHRYTEVIPVGITIQQRYTQIYRSHSCRYHHSTKIHTDIQKSFLSVSPFSKDTHRYTEVIPVGITIQHRYAHIYKSHSSRCHRLGKIHTDIQKSFLKVSSFGKDMYRCIDTKAIHVCTTIQHIYTLIYRSHSCLYRHSGHIHTDIKSHSCLFYQPVKTPFI